MVRFATALALVLACSCIFGSAVASAATTVDLACGPQEPTAGTTGDCKVVVSSPEGAPTGNVQFDKDGFANLGSASCTLGPVSASESSCDFQFRITGPGSLIIAAVYENAGERSIDLHEFLVAPGGSIRIECSPGFGFPGLPTTCETFVPNTPGVPEAPSGTVNFRAEPNFGNENNTGQIDPECSLEASPGGARCAVTFVPDAIESPRAIGIVAEYEGDASHPAQFGSVLHVVLSEHQTTTRASCDPAPTTRAPITCTATVTNLNGPGVPPGVVEFEANPADGFFPQGGSGSCQLKPVEEGPKATESSCQVRYQPRRVGRQLFRVEYRGTPDFQTPEFDASGALLELEVIDPRITSTGLTCLAQTGTAAGICLVTVSDASPNPIAPAGTVKLNVPAGVNLNRETCTVSPNTKTATSSCAFSYTMDALGSAPVVAEYSGDPKTGHQPSSRQGVVSRRS
jgi:hypothetical protein